MVSKTQVCRLSYCSIHLGGTSRQRSGRTLVFTEIWFSILRLAGLQSRFFIWTDTGSTHCYNTLNIMLVHTVTETLEPAAISLQVLSAPRNYAMYCEFSFVSNGFIFLDCRRKSSHGYYVDFTKVSLTSQVQGLSYIGRKSFVAVSDDFQHVCDEAFSYNRTNWN